MTERAKRLPTRMAGADEPETSDAPDVVPLERQLCFSVYSAAHAFNAAYKPLLEPLGLTYPQYLVMLALWEKDGVSVKDIGKRLRLDSGTVTPLLKRLEKAGLVRRSRDQADERLLRVELTEQGHALRSKAAGVRPRIACALGGAEAPIQALRQEIEKTIGMLEAQQM